MPFQAKQSTAAIFRSLRNRRFAAAGKLSSELRRYLELLEHLPPNEDRVRELGEQLAVVRKATALYDKLHLELLRYLEQHPELGLPALVTPLPQIDVSDIYERHIA